MSDTLSLRAAAAVAGMHYMTVYRWVRTGRLPATKVGGAWQVEPADLAQLLADGTAEHDEARSRTGTRQPRHAATRRRLRQRLVAGDEPGVWAIVEGALANGAEPSQVHLELLLPAMRSIGDDWAAGELTVAAEHRASAVAHRVVGRLGPRFVRRGRRRGRVVCGSAPGDVHGLPVAVTADLLRSASYDVVDLGADTPVESFVDAVAQGDRPVAVVVAATRGDNDANVRATIQAVEGVDPSVPVIVGGPGIAGSDPRGLEGAMIVGRLHDLVDTIEQLHG